MKLNTLKEDLIRDFQDQKKAVNEQLSLIDPMATSLRTPAAKRLFDTGLLLFMEVICWILLLVCVAFTLFMNKLYPFLNLTRFIHDTSLQGKYAVNDLRMLDWAVKGIAILAALLFMVIARMLAAIRNKNNVLHLAGKNMKLLAEQLLKRKAAMESLEQRNPIEMPSNNDTVIIPAQKPHDDILL